MHSWSTKDGQERPIESPDAVQIHRDHGVRIADPHVCTVEDGGDGQIDPAVVAMKVRLDPQGLLSPGKLRKMSFEDFQYAFVNTLPLDEQRAAYERYVVPESRRVPRESTGGIAKIDFKNARHPLLIIAGSADHIIPASLNRSNYEKYRQSPSVTEFKEFAGRVHFIIGQQGWEEVADFAASWMETNVRA